MLAVARSRFSAGISGFPLSPDLGGARYDCINTSPPYPGLSTMYGVFASRAYWFRHYGRHRQTRTLEIGARWGFVRRSHREISNFEDIGGKSFPAALSHLQPDGFLWLLVLPKKGQQSPTFIAVVAPLRGTDCGSRSRSREGFSSGHFVREGGGQKRGS